MQVWHKSLCVLYVNWIGLYAIRLIILVLNQIIDE